MQASIILQGRSVHRARQVLPIEVRRSTEGASASLFLSTSFSCSRSCFLLPSSFSFSLLLAPAAGQPTYVEMLRCKTVDCQGAVFSLCTAMVAVGVPGTTKGRRPRPPHRALPRLCLLYFGTRVCVRARTYTRPRRARARAAPFTAWSSIFVADVGMRNMPYRSRSEWRIATVKTRCPSQKRCLKPRGGDATPNTRKRNRNRA